MTKDSLIRQMKEEDRALLAKLKDESAKTHKGFVQLKKRIKKNSRNHRG